MTAPPHAQPAAPGAIAQAFLTGLADPRAPWGEAFVRWALDRRMSDAETRAVKVAVLRARAFGAGQRFRPKRRRLS